MKLKYLLSAAMLSAAMTASAVPAYPGLIQRTLEDGTPVNVRLYGDEFFHYMTDEQGYLLSQEGKALNYKMSNGSKVMATDALIEQMRIETEAAAPVQKIRQAAMQRMATLDKNGRTSFPTTGEVHFLVLLVQYDDVKFSSSTIHEDMDAMLNKEGYTQSGSHGSMRDYYIASSGGKFTPVYDVAPVVTLPKTSAYYTGNGKYDNVRELVIEAATLADADVDYSKYCYQTPGVCDAIIIYYAGHGQADTADPTTIWPHQSTIYYEHENGKQGIFRDNTRLGVYCCFNELNSLGKLAGIGTPIHEFGHVMGMPDLYDPAYKVSSTPTYWSIFDMGPYLGNGYYPPTCSAYERWLFNWLEFEDVEDGTHYSLEELNENNRALRICARSTTTGELNPKEFFVLESRNDTEWDKYLPGHGMLIWHIDYNNTYWKNNTVNSTESHKRCHLITADGSATYELNRFDRTSDKAAWPNGPLNYLTPDTEITLNTYWAWDNMTGHSYITSIDFDPTTGVTDFNYNTITEQPADLVSVMSTPVRGTDANGNPNNDLVLSWQPVEGATGYLLTVYRQSGSTKYYEGELNEYNVGMATEYVIPSLSRNKMGLEYHAYVRVLNEIPALDKSNEIVFVPNTLEAVGVDAIEGENVEIIGLNGAIQAPAGAEIYNMQGTRCAAQGLAPGVYVVRYGNTVTKAVVK